MTQHLYLAAVLTLAGCAHPGGAVDGASACPSTLTPLNAPPPELPAILHNEFAGTAMVRFVIGPDGRTSSPTVSDTEWRPLGDSSGQPKGYVEAIEEAVLAWRYPPQRVTCVQTVPVTFFPEADS